MCIRDRDRASGAGPGVVFSDIKFLEDSDRDRGPISSYSPPQRGRTNSRMNSISQVPSIANGLDSPLQPPASGSLGPSYNSLPIADEVETRYKGKGSAKDELEN
eukprot:TRINITY_DN5982_c0_g2_i2.p2 TRINITY_DN5982_c0_g2~~TRINITY_DN5982_c0_g2_i2.p2  ORF type:complete len:104 (+),score=2.07 TRINITY_DN5982_c0_g2_i2:65-376(+)